MTSEVVISVEGLGKKYRLGQRSNERYTALRDELRGDALTALGRKDEARTAYTDALTNLDPNAPTRSYIEMKRNDLGGAEKKGS